MGRYVIERNVPGAGDLGDAELHDLSARSNEVLAGMQGTEWVESYVSDDALVCVDDADDSATIEEHAREGGFPCDRISPVHHTVSPATGR